MKLNDQSLIQLHNHERKNNIIYFANYYFPHYLKKESSELHFYLYGIFQSMLGRTKGEKEALAAPRGNAKSSIGTLIVPLFMALNGHKQYTVLLSDSSTQANSFLEDIREEIENNAKIIEDYGDQVGDIWQSDKIILASGPKIQALGAKKKIRGLKHRDQRPDLVIGDDLENDENVINPEQRRKLSDWWAKAVCKCGDDTTDYVIVGTILHYDSLLANLLKNPVYRSKKFQAVIKFSKADALWSEWEEIFIREKKVKAGEFFEKNKKAMMEGIEVLWEDEQPYYDLMTIRLSDGPASFDSEYQNNPINPEDCLFREEWFKFYEMNTEYTQIVGAVDPSLGKALGDYCAIIFLGKHKDGFIDVLVADLLRLHPDEIITNIINNAKTIYSKYPNATFTTFGVETVAFQEYFKDRLAAEARKAKIYIPISETENQTSRKSLRIQSLQPHIKNGTIRFSPAQKILLEQLKYYPLADHDDGPDALEMAVRKLITPELASISY